MTAPAIRTKEQRVAVRAMMSARVRRTQLRLVSQKIHVNKRGDPLEFQDHYFMIAIFNDGSPMIVIMSSVQTGKTEYLISYAIACCEEGLSVFHVLPKYDIRNAFIDDRIDPLIADVPEYRVKLRKGRDSRDTKGADNKSIKRYATGTWRFVSSNVSADFKGFDADVTLADDIDEFDMKNFAKASKRLEGSDFKFGRYCSNPSYEGFGIHKLFVGGKQFWIHYRCDACEAWRKVDFFDCVALEITDDGGNVIDYELREGVEDHDEYVCHHCSGELNRERWKWIAINPDAPYPSYQISKLLKRTSSPLALFATFMDARSNDTDLEVFYNDDLGLPFSPAGSKLTDDLIKRACVLESMPDYIDPDEKGVRTAGIDVGTYYDVRISRRVLPEGATADTKPHRHAICIARVQTDAELLELLESYRVRAVVIDAFPETRKAKELQKACRRKGIDFWLCAFKSGEGKEAKIMTKDADERIVKIDRTYAVDCATADFREGCNRLPVNGLSLLDGFYKESMKANKRQLVDTPSGGKSWRWSKEANDHARFADVYDMIAGWLFGTPAFDATPTEDPNDVFEAEGALIRHPRRGKGGKRAFMEGEGDEVLTKKEDEGKESEGPKDTEQAEADALKRLF